MYSGGFCKALTEFTNTRGHVLAGAHVLLICFQAYLCFIDFPGCIAERKKFLPMILFAFIWSVIIYNPVTYWFWNSNGWLSVDLGRLPVLDFCWGTVFILLVGFTCLAYSYILGPRNPKLLYNYRNPTPDILFLVHSWYLWDG